MDARTAAATLEAERRGLAAELDRLTAVPRDPMAPLSFGKRIGEGTNEAVERLNRVGVVEKLRAKAADVDRAIAKLDEGTYGVCDGCGKAIPAERLEAMPWATLCVDCAASR